jgi:hypothetical protein
VAEGSRDGAALLEETRTASRSCPGFSGSMRARYICAAHCGQSGRALMGVLSSVYSVNVICDSANKTGQKLGHAKMMTAPMPSTASARTIAPRLARVSSIAAMATAPIG